MRRTWVLCVAAGCIDSSSGKPPSDAVTKTNIAVTVDTNDQPPLFVASRDGDEPWQSLPIETDGSYLIEVANDYAFAVVCGDSDGYTTSVRAGTREETKASVSCIRYGAAEPAATVAVTGRMLQPGTVTLDESKQSTTAPWTFELAVAPGTHDLFAFGSERVLITRDIVVSGALALPDIDLATGVPYDVLPVQIGGRQADEASYTSLMVITGNSGAYVELPGTAVKAVPDALLMPVGFQLVYAGAETATTTREVSVDPVAGASLVDLLPRLDGVTVTADGAQWDALPAADDVAFAAYSMATGNSLQVKASSAWAAGRNAVGAQVDAAGYSDAWRLGADATSALTVSDETRSTQRRSL